MAWHLTKDAQNKVFLGFKDTVAFELGPITAFQESMRGKNILNVRCEKGSKAVKISNFVKTKSVEEFAMCTTVTRIQLQLESFVSKECSVWNSRRSPSSPSDDVVPSSEISQQTTLSGTPNSGSASKTYHQPVTPDIGNNEGNNAAVGTNSDTPCRSKHQRICKRRLPEADATEIIQSLPRKDVLSPLQQRFKECKVGRSNDWYSSQKLFCNKYSFILDS